MEILILGAMIFGTFYGLCELFNHLAIHMDGILEVVFYLACWVTIILMFVVPGMFGNYLHDHMTSEFDETLYAACFWHYFYLAIWLFAPLKERKK